MVAITDIVTAWSQWSVTIAVTVRVRHRKRHRLGVRINVIVEYALVTGR